MWTQIMVTAQLGRLRMRIPFGSSHIIIFDATFPCSSFFFLMLAVDHKNR